MINVGFYYKVKKGHEEEFENAFKHVVEYLKSFEGFRGARLYKSVEDPSEYLIYSEWDSIDAFRKFVESQGYKDTVTYGRTIIEDRPRHKIFQEVNG
ncbi:antibiotic biosynthesis monooxygenase family protein [Stygiolobus caldivivus]|uniref:Antibiotic biosynthesis monooxygenase n=1 Tax=Stygiolobus caldivivus TaxID=2824673 RepID=A0A8D5U9F8_9CREN|nr:antibiotic biosynthesis monooxygenase [Stygiolobus caldivivus]BCU71495.1 antibiotic biosynthesis monooxygenase [Stygiolobus caldivivus]